MTNAILLAQRLLSEEGSARALAAADGQAALRRLGAKADGLLRECTEAEAAVLLHHAATLPLPSPAPEVVLTMPPRIRHGMSALIGGGHATTRRRVQDLLSTARRTVFVMAPYCHPGAVPDVAPGLNAAAEAGARIRIYLRRHDDWDNSPFIDALAREPAGRSTTFFEILDDDHLSHAKVVIVDEQAAYVGSGNLTPQGYGTNLEAGVIIQGEPAADLYRALDWYVAHVQTSDPFGGRAAAETPRGMPPGNAFTPPGSP